MAKVVYTGVSNKARKCKALYVGVNNKARKIKKGYVGVSNTARLFYTSDVVYTWDTYNVNSTTTTTYSTSTVTTVYAHAVKNTSTYFIGCSITSTDATIYGVEKWKASSTNLRSCLNNGNSNGHFLIFSSYAVDSSASTIRTIYKLTGTSSAQSVTNGTLCWKFASGTTTYNTNLTAYNVTIYKVTVSTSTSYSKGSTYYGTVTATNNPNAYPTNGQSGNYWYVRR